jgi:hypothetical protein
MSFFDDASLVMIPSGYKDQKVYSVKPTDGTGDLTFSRASSATRVQSDGLIEKVRTNLVLQSETFDNASWTKGDLSVSANTIANPLNGATTADTIVEAATTGQHYLFQSPSLTGVFTYSIYAKAKERSHIVIGGAINPTNFYSVLFNLTSGTVQQANNGSSTGITASIVSAGNGWYRCSVALSSAVAIPYAIWTSDGTTLAPTYYEPSYTGNGTSGLYIFGAQVETGDIATDYIATTTAAVSVGPVSGLPRLDYLGSTCPKLLLEPQRTNNALYSEQLDNAAWTKQNTTVTANAVTSPSGYQDADKLIETASTGAHRASVSSGATLNGTFSFFAKAGERTKVAILSTTIDLGFDLSNGTLINLGSGTSVGKIENYGNGWYRCSLPQASGIVALALALLDNAGNISYTGNGTSGAYFWGAQLEVGAYATSYIPTLGASVTRVADAASKTGITSLIGQTAGTLFAEFVVDGANPSARIISVSDGTTANRIVLLQDGLSIRVFVAAAGVGQVDISFGTWIGSHKIAVAYANNDLVVFLDGVLAATDTSISVPACSAAQVGTFEDNTNITPLGGVINQALIFKTRLTNSQLAELTA